MSGNSLACRVTHVGLAQESDSAAVAHCPHAGGQEYCADDCSRYCKSMAETCTGANGQFINDAECQAACALVPAGDSFIIDFEVK